MLESLLWQEHTLSCHSWLRLSNSSLKWKTFVEPKLSFIQREMPMILSHIKKKLFSLSTPSDSSLAKEFTTASLILILLGALSSLKMTTFKFQTVFPLMEWTLSCSTTLKRPQVTLTVTNQRRIGDFPKQSKTILVKETKFSWKTLSWASKCKWALSVIRVPTRNQMSQSSLTSITTTNNWTMMHSKSISRLVATFFISP